ncbi:MAG: hypothetical protein QXW41_03640 [Fervidicoccaceae archaeon]
MSTRNRWEPASANLRAVALPMPEAAPVIRDVFPPQGYQLGYGLEAGICSLRQAQH